VGDAILSGLSMGSPFKTRPVIGLRRVRGRARVMPRERIERLAKTAQAAKETSRAA